MSEEGVVSLQDVLEEDQQLEQIANAVLGDSDDSHCTYPKGYVLRQAVYACGTCVSMEMAPAGVCLACSLHCHDGHQLYELYTKRNFRCDCGNSKFPSLTCALYPTEQGKDSLNPQNKYNHNFRGLYCTCNRPYPDSEDEVEDEMIQCSVCEDWFHTRHLGGEVPSSYEELVCDACMRSHDFLRAYQLHPQPVRVEREEEEEGGGSVNVTSDGGGVGSERREPQRTAEQGPSVPDSSSNGESSAKSNTTGRTMETRTAAVTQTSEADESVSSSSSADVSTAGKPLTSVEETEMTEGVRTAETSSSGGGERREACELMRRMEVLGDGWRRDVAGAGFFGEGWRGQLCRCATCKELYSSAGTLPLLDKEDTVAAYELRAQSRPNTHDAGMAALSSSLDRVQQVEAFHQYHELKSELVDFLQDFAREGKVVAKRDIEGFFEEMQARKRQRLESGEGVPPRHCHF